MTEVFSAVMVDPPWPETGGGRIKRGCDRHYATINTKAGHLQTIVRCPHWARLNPEACHLYLWSTSNYESWAHWLIDALGFAHKVSLPWVKPGAPGLGQYWRGCHEVLMFAVRGRGYAVKTASRSLRSDALVGTPRVVGSDGRVVHSAKPPAAYDLVESRTIGPYLEMYGRGHSPAASRPQWMVWGDEAQ